MTPLKRCEKCDLWYELEKEELIPLRAEHVQIQENYEEGVKWVSVHDEGSGKTLLAQFCEVCQRPINHDCSCMQERLR